MHEGLLSPSVHPMKPVSSILTPPIMQMPSFYLRSQVKFTGEVRSVLGSVFLVLLKISGTILKSTLKILLSQGLRLLSCSGTNCLWPAVTGTPSFTATQHMHILIFFYLRAREMVHWRRASIYCSSNRMEFDSVQAYQVIHCHAKLYFLWPLQAEGACT